VYSVVVILFAARGFASLQFCLTENGGKSKIERRLGDFRKKARKSLTHSFESLKKVGVRRRRDREGERETEIDI
jgi:hypothetical protein